MWFKGSSIGAGITDAWLFNYAVGIDGMALVLILMTTILVPIVFLYYPDYYPGYAPRYVPWLTGAYWFGSTCKDGCTNVGNDRWGCQFPGGGANDCVFASDCYGCGF